MLSLFPELLDYWFFAALFLRHAAAVYFAFLALRFVGTLRTLPSPSVGVRVIGYGFVAVEVAVSVLLFVGLFVQGAALGGIVLALASLMFGIGRGSHPNEAHVQLFLMVICIALLFLGAGPFAFDVPL